MTILNKCFFCLYFLTIICILQSCKPDDAPPAADLGFFPLGDEVKDYLYFKPGTFWIYKNSLTGELDTICVNNSVLDTIQQTSKKWHFSNELFLVSSKSKSTGHEYYHYMRSLGAEVNSVTWACIPNMERKNPFEGDITAFYYPFNFHKTKPGAYPTELISIRDTMIINQNTFNKVAIYYIKQDELEPGTLKRNAAKYFWARNAGLIRKDLFKSAFPGDTSILLHSWRVINSSIIQ